MQMKSSNANYRQLRCLGQPHYKHTWQSFVRSGQCHGQGREKVPSEMLSFESGQQLPIGKVSRVTQASDLTASAGSIGFSLGRKANHGWWLKLLLHNEQRPAAGSQDRCYKRAQTRGLLKQYTGSTQLWPVRAGERGRVQEGSSS